MLVSANGVIPFDIILEVGVPDVLIRDVPEEVLSAVESHAAKLGLSRNEYLRRQLAQDARRSVVPATRADLQWFAETFSDLAEPDVIKQAWQ